MLCLLTIFYFQSDEAVFLRCQLFVEKGETVEESGGGAPWNFMSKEQTLCPQREGAAPLFGTFKRETVVNNAKQYLVRSSSRFYLHFPTRQNYSNM
jgi:hypothetical protein